MKRFAPPLFPKIEQDFIKEFIRKFLGYWVIRVKGITGKFFGYTDYPKNQREKQKFDYQHPKLTICRESL